MGKGEKEKEEEEEERANAKEQDCHDMAEERGTQEDHVETWEWPAGCGRRGLRERGGTQDVF